MYTNGIRILITAVGSGHSLFDFISSHTLRVMDTSLDYCLVTYLMDAINNLNYWQTGTGRMFSAIFCRHRLLLNP